MTASSSNVDLGQAPFRCGIVLLPRFSSLTLSSLVEPLRIANYCGGGSLYQWTYLSVAGGDVPGCSGYSVGTEAVDPSIHKFDLVMVCGGWNAERYECRDLAAWLRRMSAQKTIIGAAEMGPYFLARYGLLNGYAATLHWHSHNAFRERFPEVDLEDGLFVIDRNRMTCAGGIACLEMMLHDIKVRYGKALAAEVADQVIYANSRPASHSQKEPQSADYSGGPQVLRDAVRAMEDNVETPVKIPALANSLNISQRKLERLFNKHFGCSAVSFYRRIRLLRARVLLTQTDMSVLDICVACGFASSSYFSKSYAEQFGMRPRDHRLAWPDERKDPLWPGLNTAVLENSND